MSTSSRAYYVSCFVCQSRPATIKCLTCRPSKPDQIYEKLCYRCDNEKHAFQKTAHVKEFIPFLEMKSAKDNKDLTNSASAPYFNASSKLYSDENRKYIDNRPKNPIKSELAWKSPNVSKKNDDAFQNLAQNQALYQRNNIDLRSSQTQSATNSYLFTQYKYGFVGNYSSRRESDLNETKNPQTDIDNEIQRLKEELQQKKNLLDQTKKTNEEKLLKLQRELRDQETKNEHICSDMDKINSEYEEKIATVNKSLKDLRGEYENKLREFENMLKASTETIKNLQSEVQKNHASNKDPKENKEIQTLKKEILVANEGILKCEKELNENKQRFEVANGEFQIKMTEKDKIIEELSSLNQLKHDEIQKLDELIKNFDELFGHYKEEKEHLAKENAEIHKELTKFSELLEKIGNREGNENDDENYEEREANDNEQEYYSEENDEKEGGEKKENKEIKS